MKYNVGNIVYLDLDVTVYITEVDTKNNEYKGFDVNSENPEEILVFSESSVLMKI